MNEGDRGSGRRLLGADAAYIASTRVFFSFYLIAVFQITDDVAAPFIDYGIRALSILCSFLLGSAVVRRRGHMAALRLSLIMAATTLLAVTLLWPLVEAGRVRYPVVSLLVGFGTGWYWPAYHYVVVRVLDNTDRTGTLHKMGTIKAVLAVVVPLVGGLLVAGAGGLRALLLASAVVAGVGAMWPAAPEPDRQQTNLVTVRESWRTLRRKPHMRSYAGVVLLDKSQEAAQVGFTILVPYLILGDVLSVGIFLAGVGLVGGCVAWWRRTFSLQSNLRLAASSQVAGLLGTFALVLIWTPFGLALRAIVLVGVATASQPILSDLEARIRQDLLGDSSVDHVLTLNTLVEVIVMVARVTVAAALALVARTTLDSDAFVRIAWTFVAILTASSFAVQVAFLRSLKRPTKVSRSVSRSG